ncbi:DUF397 domain-containing protein [Actinomadura vinacea]|uniref:DUF397 domain-containing protein n=1 Tax=Actinomadura vinacea TaxID=115336 RepID=A0ABN3ILS3_9ACTN
MSESTKFAPKWRKSSRSNSQAGECVEAAGLADTVAIRDSKDPNGPTLTLPSTTWRSLLSSIKNT